VETIRRVALAAVAEANLTGDDLAAIVSPTSARPRCSGIAPPAGRSRRHRLAGSPDGETLPQTQGEKTRAVVSPQNRLAARSLFPAAPSWPGCSTTYPAHVAAPHGAKLAFGTVDTWLLWKLTGGRVHATDVSKRLAHPPAHLRTGQWTTSSCACCAFRAPSCPR